MNLMRLLHRLLEKELPFIHKVRLASLMAITETAAIYQKLFLTGLGRYLQNNNQTRSNIQKVDRLLGNEHLYKERDPLYQLMMRCLIGSQHQPLILVDWTCINSTTNLYALRASLPLSGRSIVLYEECHPKKKENNHRVHKAFLKRMKSLLPEGTQPIIVTDAGFRAPWFAQVLSMGWDFVGRLRNKNLIAMDEDSAWVLSGNYYAQARSKARCLGSGLLTKKTKVPAYFVLYKGQSKRRHKLNKNKTHCQSSKSRRYAKAHKEPWFLVTSLNTCAQQPKDVVNIYQKRMRIEEHIRDSKCPHYGLGLKKSLTLSTKRMNILLLICALASFAAWLAGLHTTAIGKAANFQAHSAKYKQVLSKFYLGREALRRGLKLTRKQFDYALQLLYEASLVTRCEELEYA